MRLGVNIDHVATIRNARGGTLPSPLRAAEEAIKAGADGITIHLREDRRHIRDQDAIDIKAVISKPLNFEMAITKEMVDFALKLKPHAACLVPERREERTTEGGLDVVKNFKLIKPTCLTFKKAGIRASLFIAPDPNQINAAYDAGAPVIELHTGAWCDYLAHGQQKEADSEFRRLREAIKQAATLGLEVHAGHGLNYETAGKLAQFSEIKELNIGHFLVGEAVFVGFGAAIQKMKAAMQQP